MTEFSLSAALCVYSLSYLILEHFIAFTFTWVSLTLLNQTEKLVGKQPLCLCLTVGFLVAVKKHSVLILLLPVIASLEPLQCLCLAAVGRFNKNSEDALGFLRLGSQDIALEFVITGLRSADDRKSKNIKLSTLPNLFSLAQEANAALASLLYCGSIPSGDSLPCCRDYNTEWNRGLRFPQSSETIKFYLFFLLNFYSFISHNTSSHHLSSLG